LPTVYWEEGDGPAAEKSALPKLDSTTEVPIEDIRFDRPNPRLIGQDTDASDEFVIAQRDRSAIRSYCRDEERGDRSDAAYGEDNSQLCC